MAGLQSCFRKVVINNSLRFVIKNGIPHQPIRGRHCIVFQMLIPKNTHCYRNLKLLSNTNLKQAYRLASTNVTSSDDDLKALENVKFETTGSAAGDAGKVVDEVTNASPVVSEDSLPPIPKVEEFDFITSGLTEPTFESLGLGSYWPPGLIQQALEYLHIHFDLPWWGAIAIVTTFFRILLFPLAVKARRQAIEMQNNLPQLQKLQLQISDARLSGNYYDAAIAAQELYLFMQQKNISMLGPIIPTLSQAPVFLSMYFGLKKMAEVPVESLKTGGLFWFQDLTVPDPYYVLPIVTACTLYVIMEIGAEGASMSAQQQLWMKIIMRVIPVVMVPFIIGLPEIVLWYWTVSNFITLGQTIIFKIPPVRKYFKIPVKIIHDPATLPMRKKGMIEGFKEGMSNARITKELEERERLSAVTFANAGKGPVRRTFKHNPKQQPQKATVSGK